MTKRRETIARRLVEAQHNAAMLTTFNEVDMTAVMALRERQKEIVQEALRHQPRHRVVLRQGRGGGAARRFRSSTPRSRATRSSTSPIYDIGMAVGAEGGLVVPVLRNAETMAFAGIETAIREYAKKAPDGTLTLEDLAGRHLHHHQRRRVRLAAQHADPEPAAGGASWACTRFRTAPWPSTDRWSIRPMMYVALSYDHRIVDGREAVQFLVKIKEFIEDPGPPAARRASETMPISIRPVVAIALAAAACGAHARPARRRATAAPPDLTAPPADATKSATGLISKVLQPGDEREKPAATDIVTVHYTGWSSDGKMFDSSVARGNPSTFPLSRVMAGLARVRAADGDGREAPLLGAAGAGLQGSGRAVPPAPWSSTSSCVDTRPSPTIPPPDVAGPPDDAKRTASGLAYKVLRPGTGVRHPDGLRDVTVHYTGWTTDGKMFDSSVPRGAPDHACSLDDVIRGWTEGVQLMVEGERTRFWIPQDLAYKGQAGSPRGMLVFDIDLVRIE